MPLRLDMVRLRSSDPVASHSFYRQAFALNDANATDAADTPLNIHGKGQLHIVPGEGIPPASPAFDGYVLGAILQQPTDVDQLLGAAHQQGARMIKPAKKQFFGDYSASFHAPQGAIWKVSAATKKNSATGQASPKPNELLVLLGVEQPQQTATFYQQLGMLTRHDYGDKFIDFQLTERGFRLGLLPRKGLAKDVGVNDEGKGHDGALTLCHHATSREALQALLDAARAAGAGNVLEPHQQDGQWNAGFSDPAGYGWKLTSPV